LREMRNEPEALTAGVCTVGISLREMRLRLAERDGYNDGAVIHQACLARRSAPRWRFGFVLDWATGILVCCELREPVAAPLASAYIECVGSWAFWVGRKS